MKKSTIRPTTPSMGRLDRLTLIGIIASTLAITLASAVMIYAIWSMARQDSEFAQMILEDLDIATIIASVKGPQLWLATLFWSGLDILGLIMLFQVRSLFVGFRKLGVFTAQSARRLRRVGWCVLALGPGSILMGALASLTLSLWQTGNGVSVSMAIDQGDVYAIVVGLVIISVGHIMLEAVRLSEENNAFI